VVLPTFNRLDYLSAAIASVFDQTLSDWELLIADDGSEEPTRDYLRSLENLERVRVLWGSHRGVPGIVRNSALAHAQGDYVAFIDSDDLWMPQKLACQVEALREAPRCRWCYTDYAIIDSQGVVRPETERRLPTPEGWIFEPLLANAVDIWTPAVMVERQLLMMLGGFDPRLVSFEDYDLWLRLAAHSEILLLREPLIAVRRHAQHFDGAARGASMAASRYRSLLSLRQLVSDTRLRAKIDCALVGSTLELANTLAAVDRSGAARCMFALRSGAWRYGAWWMGLPGVLLKMLLPRAVLAGYRRCRELVGVRFTGRQPHT
jgi:GT2 family glycosyltransferase